MNKAQQQPDSPEPALGPPRFSLRALLLAVSLLCGLFAVMAAVGMLWSAAIALFLGLILAHVLGNSIGTRLRDEATRQIAAERQTGKLGLRVPVRTNVAAPRRLTERARLHRITLVMAGLGAIVGGELGSLEFGASYPRGSLAAAGLGVVSAAVLGAFAGFAASSLLSVVRQALAEAHRGADPMARPASGRPR